MGTVAVSVSARSRAAALMWNMTYEYDIEYDNKNSELLASFSIELQPYPRKLGYQSFQWKWHSSASMYTRYQEVNSNQGSYEYKTLRVSVKRNCLRSHPNNGQEMLPCYFGQLLQATYRDGYTASIHA